ncbi:MAG: hypothetical protein AABY26_02140 [Nanoarchaeota archaeon]
MVILKEKLKRMKIMLELVIKENGVAKDNRVLVQLNKVGDEINLIEKSTYPSGVLGMPSKPETVELKAHLLGARTALRNATRSVIAKNHTEAHPELKAAVEKLDAAYGVMVRMDW